MRVSTAACPACHRENQIEHDDSIKGERGVIVTCDHCGVTKRLTAFRKEHERQRAAIARQLATADRNRRKAEEAARIAQWREEQERDRVSENEDSRAEESTEQLSPSDRRSAPSKLAMFCQNCQTPNFGNRTTCHNCGALISLAGFKIPAQHYVPNGALYLVAVVTAISGFAFFDDGHLIEGATCVIAAGFIFVLVGLRKLRFLLYQLLMHQICIHQALMYQVQNPVEGNVTQPSSVNGIEAPSDTDRPTTPA